MIERISIKDFAIIENTEIEFTDGLSVITGETGSGKSIVVTAISLALGSRADSSYVRHGADKAIVELAGELNGDEIVISREVSSSGKNLCRLKGRMVTLSELSETCSLLADIHGQYDNQSLLDPGTHLSILDDYRRDKILPIKIKFKAAYDTYIKKKTDLDFLLSMQEENQRKLDFYRYEIKEIDDAKLRPGEYEELKDRFSLLQNSEKIFASANLAYEYLNGGSDSYTSQGSYNLISSATEELKKISEFSSDLQNMENELDDIYYRLEDIISDLRNICESMNFSPDELDQNISRIALIDSLIKKYSLYFDPEDDSDSVSKILSYRNSIFSSLSKIENFDREKDILLKELEISKNNMLDLGNELTAARQVSAEELENKIMSQLKDLNFEDAELKISFTELSAPTSEGLDSVEILISTNKGEPLKSLVKTASGGEISRIMLAIKSIVASFDNIPTLIFDEIDQGISGKTAAVVGKKLREIAKHHQVICITHLPQIAAKSDTGYRIYKESDTSNTYTHVERLTPDEKIKEIARLIGGETISDAALNAAKELIENS